MAPAFLFLHMSRYSATLLRAAARSRRNQGIGIASNSLEQREEQPRLDAEADGHLYVPSQAWLALQQQKASEATQGDKHEDSGN